MMHLTIAPEPASFQATVREPGENALALLAGEPLPHRRDGRPLERTKLVRGVEVPRQVDDFPYWQDCLEDLHTAYEGICAYYCHYVPRAHLPHVDHFLAKRSGRAELAYTWSNYRLACGHANTRKRSYPDVLDPAEIQDGWFQLDLDTLMVRPDPSLNAELRQAIDATISRLDLSGGRALEVRTRAMRHFRAGAVQMAFLQLDHPFLARELLRQGVFTRDQLPAVPAAIIAATEPEL